MITLDMIFDKQSEVDSIIVKKLSDKHEERINNRPFVSVMLGEEYDFNNTLSDRVIAFKVELCELANEIGFFKYWKTSHKHNDFRIKGEWSDCLAFLVSIIGSTDNREWFKNKVDLSFYTQGGHIPREFNELMNNKMKGRIDYKNAFGCLMWLGIACGYSKDELFEAYMNKSEENIRRAKDGY